MFAVIVFNHLSDSLRYIFADIIIAAALFNRFGKGYDLIADPFPVKLIKVAFILRLILKAHFKIIGFPPRRRHVNIAFRTGDDQLALRFCSLGDFYGSNGSVVNKVYFCKSVEIKLRILVFER